MRFGKDIKFSIFEDFELLEEIPIENEIALDNCCTLKNKCGELIIEILNNYLNIKQDIELEIKRINYNWNTYQKWYSFLLFPNTQKGYLDFFYNILSSEFREIGRKVEDARDRINKITPMLNDYQKKYNNTKLSKEQIEKIEKIIEEMNAREFSDKQVIERENDYLNNTLENLEEFIFFVNNFIDNKEVCFLEKFIIPRNENYLATKEKNKIKVLKSNNSKNFNCSNIEYLTIYDIESINDILSIYKKMIIDKKITIRKCKNCGKYFMPQNRTDEKYCNNPSPQNSNKTCKEIGAVQFFKNESRDRDIGIEHNKTSEFFKARMKRSKNITEQKKYEKKLDKYRINYRKQKEKYNKGILKKDEFIDWIIKQKENAINSKK